MTEPTKPNAGQNLEKLDPATCWAALCARDARYDGTFVYTVRTTGIYCRPSCWSRLPRVENVAFFHTAAEAEKAGFRPCKRCRPAEPSPVERHRRAIARACALIREAEAALTVSQLADAVGMSRYHFHRVFRELVGSTPGAYLRTHRLQRFAGELDNGAPVAEAVYAAGFTSSSRAYAAASNGLGMTPGARRRGGAGQTIRYTIAQTWIGWVILAVSAQGVCAAAFGDHPQSLVADLRRRFASATLIEDQDDLRSWMQKVIDYLAAPGARVLDLPLDIQGTAFQARVWQALRKIPPGQTVSYADIAAALGQPNAVRAVARACASNAIAMFIPCHRVVRSDGGLAGYRWGVERKRALLAAEQQDSAARPPQAVAGPLPRHKRLK